MYYKPEWLNVRIENPMEFDRSASGQVRGHRSNLQGGSTLQCRPHMKNQIIYSFTKFILPTVPRHSLLGASCSLMVASLIILLLTISSGPLCFADPHPYDHVVLVGKPLSIPVPASAAVHIENHNILKVKDHIHSITVTGKKKGLTHIMLGKKRLSILSLPPQMYSSFQSLNTLTSAFLGTTTEYHQGELIISGNLYRSSDLVDILNKIESSPTPIKIHAKVFPKEIDPAKTVINQRLKDQNLPPYKINFGPPWSLLFAHHKEDKKKHLRKVVGQVGFASRFTKDWVNPKPLVKMQVALAEISKSTLTQAGLNFDNGLTYSFLPQDGIGGNFSASAILSNHRANGKVYANPTLVAESGHKAEFFAGGEFPVLARVHEDFSQISWKPYGLKMIITPTHYQNDIITLDIHFEVSEIDHGKSLEGNPSIKINKVTTFVSTKPGQTLLLSGLIKENKGQGQKGLAGLSEIPILGALFSSHDFNHDLTELAIFISPVIDNKMSSGQ